VSTNLIEALKIFKMICPDNFDVLGEEEDRTQDFELLVSTVLGLEDPFDLDTETLDHDLLVLFWETVERIREELLYRRLVRGTLHSIKLINSHGLIMVEFKEFQHPWLHKTCWFRNLL
jgi:hypothetical protein